MIALKKEQKFTEKFLFPFHTSFFNLLTPGDITFKSDKNTSAFLGMADGDVCLVSFNNMQSIRSDEIGSDQSSSKDVFASADCVMRIAGRAELYAPPPFFISLNSFIANPATSLQIQNEKIK